MHRIRGFGRIGRRTGIDSLAFSSVERMGDTFKRVLTADFLEQRNKSEPSNPIKIRLRVLTNSSHASFVCFLFVLSSIFFVGGGRGEGEILL